MSNKNSEFYDNFTKDIYSTLKGLGHDDKGDFIIDTYESLYGRLKTEQGEPEEESVSPAPQPQSGNVRPEPDLDKIREEISHIRGIGKQKLAEIMKVIEKNLYN